MRERGAALGGERLEVLTGRQARWLAVAAQGLDQPLPATASARPGPRGRERALERLAGVMARVGTIQVDAVNIVARAHHLVPFSRLGAYRPDDMTALAGPGGPWFEHWGHAASLLPVELYPLLRWRMEASRHDLGPGGRPLEHRRAWRREHATYLAQVLDEVAERGPLSAAALSDPRRQKGQWWDRRSLGRRALELALADGLVCAWRTANFERVYDLTERVLAPEVVGAPVPPVRQAKQGLLEVAARCLGVATVADLADYFWLPPAEARDLVADLVQQGRLVPVAVEGWAQPAFMVPGAEPARPRRREAALLSPFDSLIWTRPRAERLFGFHYRVEIYVPAPQRRHGYYVLPMLLGDALVGRLDLKADRAAGELVVRGAYAEEGTCPARVAGAAARALERARAWLGLDRVTVVGRGDLAPALMRLTASSALRQEPL